MRPAYDGPPTLSRVVRLTGTAPTRATTTEVPGPGPRARPTFTWWRPASTLSGQRRVLVVPRQPPVDVDVERRTHGQVPGAADDATEHLVDGAALPDGQLDGVTPGAPRLGAGGPDAVRRPVHLERVHRQVLAQEAGRVAPLGHRASWVTASASGSSAPRSAPRSGPWTPWSVRGPPGRASARVPRPARPARRRRPRPGPPPRTSRRRRVRMPRAPAQRALGERRRSGGRHGVAGGVQLGAEQVDGQVGGVVGAHRCSSRRRVSAASLARARLAWLLTVPTEQPSSAATSRSPRSSR